jgi:hypothetical protein
MMTEISKIDARDYIEEILLWCNVVNQVNEPESKDGLTEKEERARHNAICALHFATSQYIRKYSVD